MTNLSKHYLYGSLLLTISFSIHSAGFSQRPPFPWPEGKRMALSLSLDDSRSTNPTGAALLNEYDVQATFYVLPRGVRDNLPGWEAAVKWGHEIANHSVHHPCSGNFGWPRFPLEDYTLDRMRKELEQANAEIKELLGVEMVSYAYPCGHTTLGKGKHSQSLIPLISDMFLTGRKWLSETPVDPWYCDMAALTGIRMDNSTFEEILPLIESASEKGQWLILAGHETGGSGRQKTHLSMLRKLCEYAQDPANGIWIAPVGTVGKYVKEKRELFKDSINIPRITYTDENGELILNAINGKGIGPNIEYMPEWGAFGWFTGEDRVEWDVEVSQAGKFQVEMEWSVSDEEAGKDFVIEVGDQQLKGKVGKTGSWETFRSAEVGQIELSNGYHRIVFRPATEFEGGALLDLRKLVITPR